MEGMGLMSKETVIILDFGGQYSLNIARKVRDLKVYCEILPYHASVERIQGKNPIGIIFARGATSTAEEVSDGSAEGFEWEVPVLELDEAHLDDEILKNFLYDIYITEGTRTVLVKGFLDTGNELREPVTNLPCIIVENTYFNQFEIADDKKFIIKYDTINEVGEVRGFKGQNIMIRNEEANSWTKVEAVICGCERKLSKEDEFQALLSRGIV